MQWATTLEERATRVMGQVTVFDKDGIDLMVAKGPERWTHRLTSGANLPPRLLISWINGEALRDRNRSGDDAMRGVGSQVVC
jgi:hypothetical protein